MLLINLKRSSQALAASALILGAVTAAVPALIAVTPLPAATSGEHLAALGCTRADVCTTAIAASTLGSAASGVTAAEFYPIAPENSVVLAVAAPGFVCYDACQRN